MATPAGGAENAATNPAPASFRGVAGTALRAAPERFSGLAAGVNTTVSRLGGLLAIPAIGAVIVLVFAARSGAPNADPFSTTAVSAHAHAATMDAFRAGMAVAAGLCVAGAALAYRGIAPEPSTAPETPVASP